MSVEWIDGENEALREWENDLGSWSSRSLIRLHVLALLLAFCRHSPGALCVVWLFASVSRDAVQRFVFSSVLH